MKLQLILIALAAAAGLLSGQVTQTQSSQEKAEEQGILKLGETQKRILASETTHVWSLTLEVGQYVVVEVLEKSIDVVVRVMNPQDIRRAEFNNLMETWGTEKATWIAEIAGIWKVEIAPFQASQPGDYEIKWAILRKANETYRQMVEADSLNNLAHIYYDQSKYTEAESLSRRSLEIREKTLEPGHPNIAESLNNLASLYTIQGKYAEAEPLYKRAIEIWEKTLGAEHRDLATSLNNLGWLKTLQSKYSEAEPLYKRSLAIFEKTLGTGHPKFAECLNNVSINSYHQGKYIDAEMLQLQLLMILEKALGPNHFNVATGLTNLGKFYSTVGKYDKAELCLRRALMIGEKSRGSDHPELATNLNNLAVVYADQGKYAEAERLYRRALALYEKGLGPDHPYVAIGLSNLGSVYRAQGKYAEAEPLYKRSLAISEKNLGPDHPSLASDLSNMARLYRDQSKYAEAEALYKRSLNIREKALGPDHPNVATSCSNLAGLYRIQGKFAEAESLHRRALAIREKALGLNHPAVAQSLINLARTIFLKGGEGPEDILPLMDRAILILDATTGYPESRIISYALRARIRKQNKDSDGALKDLAEALHSAEKLRPQIGSGEETRADFLAQYANDFSRMVTWQLEAGQIEKALEYAERSRTRVLLDQLAAGQIDLRNSIPADTRISLENHETEAKARLAECQQRIRLMRSRKGLSAEEKNRQIALLQDSLRAADHDYQQVYEEIKNASPLWQNLITSSGKPIELAAIQQELIAEKNLMLYYQIGNEGSWLFVIPPSGQKVQVAILQVADSLAAILGVTAGPLTSEKLQSILLGQDSTHSNLSLFKFLATNPDSLKPGQAQSAMAKLHALWQTLVPSELWARFVASSEVIIIPDGSLHLLPFEALAVENNSTKNEARYWLDAGPVIRYAPSATTLYNLTKRIKASTKREPSILSLADPIFDPKQVAEAQTQPDVAPAFASADTVSTVQRALEWEQVVSVYRDNFERTGALGRLPATAQEGQALRKAFGNARVFSLTGLHATELELRQALPGKRFIHLATHGVVDQQRSSAFAALALTPPPTATKEAENDGFLQLCEIYDLKLPECELAVLSACQTNYGRYFEGEGVFALSRGFLAAGAQRVVASQWSVKDVSSYRLMEAFFRQLAAAEKKGQRIDYALALREAKAKVRRQKLYASPYHWAAFVLAGVR